MSEFFTTADKLVRLYKDDCRVLLPTFEDDSFDLGCIDPPYPGLKGGTTIRKGGSVAQIKNKAVTLGAIWNIEPSEWMPEAWRVCKLGMMVFCSYHSVDEVARIADSLGAQRVALVTWYKRNSAPSVNNVPYFQTEFIWCFKKKPGLNWHALKTFYDIPKLPAGCMATERYLKPGTKSALHPCQKPEELIKRLLLCEPSSVIDCFSGTGTTNAAAYALGIPSVGIEENEQYCQIAANRFNQMRLV